MVHIQQGEHHVMIAIRVQQQSATGALHTQQTTGIAQHAMEIWQMLPVQLHQGVFHGQANLHVQPAIPESQE
jgi:hypothetical protein